MSISLNHTIVWCRDHRVSAQFLSDLKNIPPAMKTFIQNATQPYGQNRPAASELGAVCAMPGDEQIAIAKAI